MALGGASLRFPLTHDSASLTAIVPPRSFMVRSAHSVGSLRSAIYLLEELVKKQIEESGRGLMPRAWAAHEPGASATTHARTRGGLRIARALLLGANAIELNSHSKQVAMQSGILQSGCPFETSQSASPCPGTRGVASGRSECLVAIEGVRRRPRPGIPRRGISRHVRRPRMGGAVPRQVDFHDPS